jgi:hypothetical protein
MARAPRGSSRNARVPSVAGSRTEDAPTPGAVVSDTTLLDALHELSPEERLRWNDQAAATALELRNAFAAAQSDDAARSAGGEGD